MAIVVDHTAHVGGHYLICRRCIGFFFILSGFLAFHTAGRDIYRIYFVKRMARLLPGYYVCLGSTYFMILCIAHEWTESDLMTWPISACLVSAWMPWRRLTPPVFGASWFVSALFLFTLCFPLFRRFLEERGTRTSVIILLFVVALRTSTYVFLGPFIPDYGYYFAPVRLLDFFIGSCIAKICVKTTADSEDNRSSGWLTDVCFVGICLMHMLDFVHEAYFPADYETPKDLVYTGLWCSFCIVAYTQASSIEGSSKGLTGWILSSSAIVSLAEYSYGIYLLDVPLRFAMIKLIIYIFSVDRALPVDVGYYHVADQLPIYMWFVFYPVFFLLLHVLAWLLKKLEKPMSNVILARVAK